MWRYAPLRDGSCIGLYRPENAVALPSSMLVVTHALRSDSFEGHSDLYPVISDAPLGDRRRQDDVGCIVKQNVIELMNVPCSKSSLLQRRAPRRLLPSFLQELSKSGALGKRAQSDQPRILGRGFPVCGSVTIDRIT